MKMNRKKQIMIDWILEYLLEYQETSVVDSVFHERFYSMFKGKRKETNWGCQPVYKAMRLLKEMYDCNLIDRGIIKLDTAWQPGFPKWVYSYYVKNKGK